MGLFSAKTSYLGIDLGSSSVKIVELENYKGRPKLVTYGFTEKNFSQWNGDSGLAAVEDLAAVITDICQKAKTKSKKAIGALSNYSVFTSILNLPEMPKKELASAITWEAKKIIPVPLEEIILDWKIISEDGEKSAAPATPSAGLGVGGLNGNGINNGGNGGENSQEAAPLKKILSKPKNNLKILLTGANKALVRKYLEIFSQSGLTLLSLETESFALIRSLVGNDLSPVMVVDLGASTSSLVVVAGGVPALSRSLGTGGFALTRAISSSMNVPLERAEQFKQDMALGLEISESALPQTVEKALAPILNEIKYTVNLYQDQSRKKLEKIILTGGSALLGNLAGYLARTLNINTYVGDPWARVVYPTELKPILDRLGARFAVAIGLAMREIE